MIEYDYEGHSGKVLIIKNTFFLKKKHEFPVQIESAIAHYFDDILIVVLRQPEDKPDENVYGINKGGEIVWQFNKDNHLKLKHSSIRPYKDKENNLWLINLGGKHFKIDYKTGEVLDTKYEEIEYEYTNNGIENSATLTIGDKAYMFKGRIDKTSSYRGLFLTVRVKNDNIKERWLTHIYTASGYFISSLPSPIDLSVTPDGKYVVIIFDIDEVTMMAYYGSIAIYRNDKEPQLIVKDQRAASAYFFLDDKTYDYMPKSDCLIFKRSEYRANAVELSCPFFLIKPAENKFSWLEWGGHSIYYGFDEIEKDKIKLKDVSIRELERLNILGKRDDTFDLNKLKWLDLNQIENFHEIYSKTNKAGI